MLSKYMVRTTIAAVGLGGACLWAMPALAAPDVYDKCGSNVNGIGTQLYARSCANVAVSGTPVGNWGQISGAGTGIGNGYVDAGATRATEGVPNGHSTTTANDGWSNGASAYSNSGTVASTSSSLADGTLHALVDNPDAPWRAGATNARISDVVTFNNISGGVAFLDIGYAFDGSFTSKTGKFDDGYTNGFLALAMGTPYGEVNGVATGPVRFAASNEWVGGLAQATFDANYGTFHQEYYFGGRPEDFAFTGGYDVTSGLVEGTFKTRLVIPEGYSKFGFAFTLGLDCRGRGVTCDFSNTGAFSFGDLPTGLSYASDSGVLFSGLTPPDTDPGTGTGGAVPEPATWAMMLGGFGLVGGAARRRKNSLNAALA